MKELSWRDRVDKGLKAHLEAQINATLPHNSAYGAAKNPSTAQLWIAIANLSRQLMDVTMKNRFLESALKESLPFAQDHSTLIKEKSSQKKKVKKSVKKRA